MVQQSKKSPGHSPVWLEGYKACDVGVENHRCPYRLRAGMYGLDAEKLAQEWEEGWKSRYYNDPREAW